MSSIIIISVINSNQNECIKSTYFESHHRSELVLHAFFCPRNGFSSVHMGLNLPLHQSLETNDQTIIVISSPDATSVDQSKLFLLKLPLEQTSSAGNECLPIRNTSSRCACTICGRQHGFRAKNSTFGPKLTNLQLSTPNQPHIEIATRSTNAESAFSR